VGNTDERKEKALPLRKLCSHDLLSSVQPKEIISDFISAAGEKQKNRSQPSKEKDAPVPKCRSGWGGGGCLLGGGDETASFCVANVTYLVLQGDLSTMEFSPKKKEIKT